MKEFYLLDENGFYKGTTLLPDDTPDSDTMVSVPLPAGLHRYKFDSSARAWVEGLTPEEINSLPAVPLSNSQRIDLMQKALDSLLMGGETNG